MDTVVFAATIHSLLERLQSLRLPTALRGERTAVMTIVADSPLQQIIAAGFLIRATARRVLPVPPTTKSVVSPPNHATAMP
jgi:hypothetical protein